MTKTTVCTYTSDISSFFSAEAPRSNIVQQHLGHQAKRSIFVLLDCKYLEKDTLDCLRSLRSSSMDVMLLPVC